MENNSWDKNSVLFSECEQEGKGSFKEIEFEIKGLIATNKMLQDYQKESRKQKKKLTKIITLLIVLMFLEGVISFGIFAWYESQFEYADVENVTKEFITSGNNAHISNSETNNDITGDYNDNRRMEE